MLQLGNCKLSRHFVMCLLKAAAKNSYFSIPGHPLSSQLCAAELNLPHSTVWHTGCRLSDGSVICDENACSPCLLWSQTQKNGTAKRRRHVEARLLSPDDLFIADILLFPFWVRYSEKNMCVRERAQVCSCLCVCVEWCTWALHPDMLIAGFQLLQMCVWLYFCLLTHTDNTVFRKIWLKLPIVNNQSIFKFSQP